MSFIGFFIKTAAGAVATELATKEGRKRAKENIAAGIEVAKVIATQAAPIVGAAIETAKISVAGAGIKAINAASQLGPVVDAVKEKAAMAGFLVTMGAAQAQVLAEQAIAKVMGKKPEAVEPSEDDMKEIMELIEKLAAESQEQKPAAKADLPVAFEAAAEPAPKAEKQKAKKPRAKKAKTKKVTK